MMKLIRLMTVALLLLVTPSASAAKLRIVASSTDLASIAEMIGGEHVEVRAIARGGADLHFVQVLPSYMVKVARADIYLKIGMDMDLWADYIIDGSQNGNLLIVDCSKGIHPLEVPTGKVDASMGDIHVKGNPHYWLDPSNGVTIARSIVEALKTVDPSNGDAFDQGARRFETRLDEKMAQWRERFAGLAGTEIITYHNTWPYFSRAFGITVAGFVEPKPGIEPTPTHTAQLIKLVRARNIRVIGKEPYFPDRTPKAIARQSASTVVELPTSVGGVEEATDYFALFDAILGRLSRAAGL